ncbi:MAG: sugar transferase [Candidatus Brocadiaceae bacterium]|nr:sugar transferase [Candidatus Brocadiaceae bacterium]
MILNYLVSKRQFILILGDLCVVNGSTLLSAFIRLGSVQGLDYLKSNTISFLLTGVIFLTTFFIGEQYRTGKDFKSIGNILSIIFLCACAFIISVVMFYLFWTLRIGRGVFIINGILITFSLIGWRILYSHLMAQPIFKRKTLIIGAGWAGKTIAKEIKKSKNAGLNVVGFLDDDPLKQGKTVAGIPVLGDRHILNTIIPSQDIHLVISAITHEKHAELIKSLINCSWNGIEIVDMPTIYEQLTGKIPFKHINDMWMLHVVISKPKLYGKLVKPVIERIIAIVLIVLLIPLFVIIAILIKRDSRGKVFYTQKRVGKDATRFTIVKFRTMVENAESETGITHATENDSRITKLGRLLRKYRMDEIPQLLNVVKGDMSLIGPRPERRFFIKEYEKKIPFYSQRLAVKPGLTGWAQVKYSYANSFEQTEEKLQYDLYYIKNMSFLLDLVVLLKTVQVVLFGSGK